MMIRNLFTFLGTFAVGAVLALVARAAWFDPHAGHAPASPAVEYEPMVANPLAPAERSSPEASDQAPAAPPAKGEAAGDHGPAHGSDHAAPKAPAKENQPVNTVCAICGMDVDPSLPTATYQGKTIGFGCRMCPPKFKANPDKYGPSYLRNEVIER